MKGKDFSREKFGSVSIISSVILGDEKSKW
jgi:hypothetical protein